MRNDPAAETGTSVRRRIVRTSLSGSLMTPLAIVEGEILEHLEAHGATPLRRLVRDLSWPARMVMMAAGALIRRGLVRGVQESLEVIIEPEESRHEAWPSTADPDPSCGTSLT